MQGTESVPISASTRLNARVRARRLQFVYAAPRHLARNWRSSGARADFSAPLLFPRSTQYNSCLTLPLPISPSPRDPVKDPAAGSRLPVIVQLHGGGFCISDPSWLMYHHFYARLACAVPAVVVTAQLPLAPEHRLPAQMDPAAELLRKAADVSGARRLFDGMSERDAVLWTSMLSAYSQGGKPEEAMRFFERMVAAEVQLDAVVMVSLLLACGQLGWRRHGRSVHACCVRRFLGMPLSLGNALVDTYIKCGELAYAERVFSVMPRRDVISWSALIVGHGLNGSSDVALRLFDEMVARGVEQNSVTFLGALSACAHSGMVEKAYAILEQMKQRGIKPELKHYSCVADALGRAGRVTEAVNLIEEMPCQPDEAMLGGILAACRVHGEVDAAERISKRLLAMSPAKSGYYMSLANVYSDAGRYVDAERIRGFMKEVKVDKLPGYSVSESNN